jgi:hypothetical protein
MRETLPGSDGEDGSDCKVCNECKGLFDRIETVFYTRMAKYG